MTEGDSVRQAIVVLAMAIGMATPAVAGEPTCSDVLDIETHGQHVIGDYVAGVGHGSLGWPPAGEVGHVVGDNQGVALAGGPGPGFHFDNGFAPGASFCTDRPAFDTPAPFDD
jgi:hypothetical protein